MVVAEENSNEYIVENSIISALKSVFPDFDVECFPVDFENYTFTNPQGSILIKYLQTDFSEQNTIWEVGQETTLKFNIISCYRGLASYNEVYEPQNKIKRTIQGLEILGRKIILEKEQFLAEINTDLYCGITCKIKLWLNEND